MNVTEMVEEIKSITDSHIASLDAGIERSKRKAYADNSLVAERREELIQQRDALNEAMAEALPVIEQGKISEAQATLTIHLDRNLHLEAMTHAQREGYRAAHNIVRHVARRSVWPFS